MVKVQHALKFVTEFDETHPSTQQFLTLDKIDQIQMLESMLKDLLIPAIEPVIEKINEHGTFAILKVDN